ncbi:MAG: S41 family peptidase [Candidatus Villigracilaceae bacterium]
MSKTLRIGLIVVVVVILSLGSFAGGFVTALALPLFSRLNAASIETPLPLSTPPQALESTPSDLQTLFVPFWEAWDLVHTQYVDQPVNDIKLMRGAITGMLAALGDEHTSYMDPQQYADATTELAGEYDGIGAWVDPSGDYLTIISPIPNSPAEKAGLKPGDKIIAIDGEDMTGLDGEIVRLKILGPAGSVVHLTVLREGQPAPLKFDIVREHIVIQSVIGEMRPDGLAYIQITTFGDNTTRELRQTLDTLMAQEPKGLILDLRYNGGGYLQTAVEVASEFIGQGVILYEQYGDGTRQSYEAIPGGRATKIPLVVLINEGTASASEILAGAIQDYGRGKLVGVTSYGKGSVQNWVPLSNDQGAVRVTVAKWLTPNGRTIHNQGLTPDVVVEITEEELKAKQDPQLEKAVEVLLEMLNGKK